MHTSIFHRLGLCSPDPARSGAGAAPAASAPPGRTGPLATSQGAFEEAMSAFDAQIAAEDARIARAPAKKAAQKAAAKPAADEEEGEPEELAGEDDDDESTPAARRAAAAQVAREAKAAKGEDEAEPGDEGGEIEGETQLSPRMQALAEDESHNWAAKRITKQEAELSTLRQKAAEGVKIAAPGLSALAAVSSAEQLTSLVKVSTAWRDWCRAHPQGGSVGETEISAAQVAARLRQAEATLDEAPECRAALQERAKAKPWDQAEKAVPGLLTKDSPAHKALLALLTEHPELKLRHPKDWELKAAAHILGQRHMQDEASGAAKWVRVPMKDGKPAKAEVGSQRPPTSEGQRKPKPTPGTGTPPLRTGKSKDLAGDIAAAEVKAAKGELSGDDFEALVAKHDW